MLSVTSPARTLVDATALARLPHVLLSARALAEGVRHGLHRSRRPGDSVDFADHRPYVDGDDLRHLDWKILGRSDRLVIRRHEAESDLAVHVVVDGSASMAYRGSRAAWSKFRCAATLAATVAALVVEQQDRLSWHISAGAQTSEARSDRLALEGFCAALEAHKPHGQDGLEASLRSYQPRSRSLLLALGDTLGDPEALAAAVAACRAAGHVVVLLQVLDPDEQDLALDGNMMLQGLEDDGLLDCDPAALRAAYQDEVKQHRQRLDAACRRVGAQVLCASTSDAPVATLQGLLRHCQRGS